VNAGHRDAGALFDHEALHPAGGLALGLEQGVDHAAHVAVADGEPALVAVDVARREAGLAAVALHDAADGDGLRGGEHRDAERAGARHLAVADPVRRAPDVVDEDRVGDGVHALLAEPGDVQLFVEADVGGEDVDRAALKVEVAKGEPAVLGRERGGDDVIAFGDAGGSALVAGLGVGIGDGAGGFSADEGPGLDLDRRHARRERVVGAHVEDRPHAAPLQGPQGVQQRDEAHLGAAGADHRVTAVAAILEDDDLARRLVGLHDVEVDRGEGLGHAVVAEAALHARVGALQTSKAREKGSPSAQPVRRVRRATAPSSPRCRSRRGEGVRAEKWTGVEGWTRILDVEYWTRTGRAMPKPHTSTQTCSLDSSTPRSLRLLAALALGSLPGLAAADEGRSPLPEPKPVALLQVWGTAFDQDMDPTADPISYGDPEDDPGFKIRRARLGFEGDGEAIRYAMVVGVGANYDQLDGVESDGLHFVDASMGFRLVKGLWADIGQQKVPVSRNGNSDIFRDDNAGKLITARLEGATGKGKVYDTYGKVKGLTLGAAGDFWLNPSLSTRTLGYGGDLILRVDGLALLVEGHLVTIEPENTDIIDPGVYDETSRSGGFAQIGYSAKGFEPAVRVGIFDDDADLENNGDVGEVMGGLTYHMKGDALRFGGGYVHRMERQGTPLDNDAARLWAQLRL